MSSLGFHVAHLRWQTSARLNKWMGWLAAHMPAWTLSLLFGDLRALVLLIEEEELRAELRPLASGGRSLHNAVFRDGFWFPERAWRALQHAKRTCPVILILPQSLTLSHEVRVPLTALESLEGTIRHGLTTWTPFSHSEVYVSAQPRTVTSSQIVIDLRCALREQVQNLLDAFSEAGLRADRISLDGAIAGAAIIDPAKQQRMRRQHVIDGLLLALALILILASALQVWRLHDMTMPVLRSAIPDRVSQDQEPARGERLP